MTKFKIAICVLVLGFLSACGKNKEATPSVKYSQDVDGCKVSFINNPQGYDYYIAKCESDTTTITYHKPSGKSSYPAATVTTKQALQKQIDDIDAKEKALNKLSTEDKKILGIKD